MSDIHPTTVLNPTLHEYCKLNPYKSERLADQSEIDSMRVIFECVMACLMKVHVSRDLSVCCSSIC